MTSKLSPTASRLSRSLSPSSSAAPQDANEAVRSPTTSTSRSSRASSVSTNKKEIRSFLDILWGLLQNPTEDVKEWIRWDTAGQLIVIPDEAKFVENVCKVHFTQSTITSFNKQMNNWQFLRYSKARDKMALVMDRDPSVLQDTRLWQHKSLEKTSSLKAMKMIKRHDDGVTKRRARREGSGKPATSKPRALERSRASRPTRAAATRAAMEEESEEEDDDGQDGDEEEPEIIKKWRTGRHLMNDNPQREEIELQAYNLPKGASDNDMEVDVIPPSPMSSPLSSVGSPQAERTFSPSGAVESLQRLELSDTFKQPRLPSPPVPPVRIATLPFSSAPRPTSIAPTLPLVESCAPPNLQPSIPTSPIKPVPSAAFLATQVPSPRAHHPTSSERSPTVPSPPLLPLDRSPSPLRAPSPPPPLQKWINYHSPTFPFSTSHADPPLCPSNRTSPTLANSQLPHPPAEGSQSYSQDSSQSTTSSGSTRPKVLDHARFEARIDRLAMRNDGRSETVVQETEKWSIGEPLKRGISELFPDSQV